MTSLLADLGLTTDQVLAAVAGVGATAAFNLVKSALMSPGAIKQIEKENALRDAKFDKLFAKTDKLERQVMLINHQLEIENDTP